MDSLESSLKECIQARARITAVMDEVAQIARDGRVGADGELPESYEQHLSSVFDGVPEGSEFARDDQYKSLLKVTQVGRLPVPITSVPSLLPGTTKPPTCRRVMRARARSRPALLTAPHSHADANAQPQAAGAMDDDVVAEDDDDDDEAALKCPITTMRLEDPERANCGHTFSKLAIRSMLRKKNGTIVCPVAGCNKPIKTADLQKDAEKVVALRRLDKAAAASQRATAADDDDEEDAL